MAEEAPTKTLDDGGTGAPIAARATAGETRINAEKMANATQTEDKSTETLLDKIYAYWLQNYKTHLIFLLYLMICGAMFGRRFWHYAAGPGYRFVRVMGLGVAFSKACAYLINFSSACLLFAVCRNFLTFLQSTWVRNYIPFYKNIDFHKAVAFCLFFYAWTHTAGHWRDFYGIAIQKNLHILHHAFGAKLGFYTPGFWYLMFRTLTGMTGNLLVGVLVIIYTFAPEFTRRAHFNWFWYSHHFFVLWFILCIIHGQYDLVEFPTFWAWNTIPILLYISERTMRARRKKVPVGVVKATQKPCKVLGLELQKPKNFRARPGEYIFLNCPTLSNFEYHPFTLTSSPDEDVISVHIKSAGDWTGALYKLFDDKSAEERITFYVDGPFGAPAEEFEKFETLILVGAGIGVTPMASILKDLKYKIQIEHNIQTKNIHFFWVTQEKSAFEWFDDVLKVLEEEPHIDDILDIQTYVTRAPKEEIGKTMNIGKIRHVHNKRPNFDLIFKAFTEVYPGKRIGVFYCGPEALDKQLEQNARKHSSHNGTRFYYHKENF